MLVRPRLLKQSAALALFRWRHDVSDFQGVCFCVKYPFIKGKLRILGIIKNQVQIFKRFCKKEAVNGC